MKATIRQQNAIRNIATIEHKIRTRNRKMRTWKLHLHHRPKCTRLSLQIAHRMEEHAAEVGNMDRRLLVAKTRLECHTVECHENRFYKLLGQTMLPPKENEKKLMKLKKKKKKKNTTTATAEIQ